MIVPGTVYWFTGLSASGKTTLGRIFADRLRAAGRAVVMLDGDELRDVMRTNDGHSAADRLAIAMRNARLCKLIADQGVDVVCATISLFHECQDWNRSQLSRYREVFVQAPRHVLEQRDPKGIYRRAASGELTQVVGIDLPAEEPRQPDVTVNNDGQQRPDDVVDLIWRAIAP